MDVRSSLQRVAPVTGYQFAVFRILFGAYLTLHFAQLIPYAGELFSRQGVLPQANLNPVHLLPSPLAYWDTPGFATGFVVVLAILSIGFTAGFARRLIALVLWYGWACLFNRNNLISNPSLAYVGFMLLACALIPPGEPLAWGQKPPEEKWFFPGWLFVTGWVLLSVGYSVSGLIKLGSPSWLNGTALAHVVNNPLARPGLFRELFLAMPPLLIKLHTWGSLALEILFVPLVLFSLTRPWAWLAMIGLHLGILLVVNFSDLTIGMLMIHAFTFDPRWLPPRTETAGRRLVLYDGVCGLCNGVVQFLLKEDAHQILRYAALQGETAAAVRGRHRVVLDQIDSVIYVQNFNQPDEAVRVKSAAVLRLCDDLGGLWRLLSWARVIPRSLMDWAYDLVAKYRYRVFGRSLECRLPSAETRSLFLA